MKFHVFGSLLGDRSAYKLIFDCLEQLGCEPVTYHVLHRKIEDVYKETPKESQQYVQKMTDWVQKADFVVFEVTVEEVSCGYEMMLTLEKGKPVIVLYDSDKGKIPNTLKGVRDYRILIFSYRKNDKKELMDTLRFALEEIKEKVSTRFTLLLPPKIIAFLDETTRKTNIPRSVFIRNLIEREMKKK